MIKISNINVAGWKAAIRGMRNPMNSWDRSDSIIAPNQIHVGVNDLDLMKRLYHAGPEHRKFMRMIVVWMDLEAPLYFWNDFDTYRIGRTDNFSPDEIEYNSCSTMHKLHSKEFVLNDFSHDHLDDGGRDALQCIISNLNWYRDKYVNSGNKDDWYNMSALLPRCYNQKRTVMLNYEVCANIIRQRSDHKLDEFHTLVDRLKQLPYLMDIITLEEKDEGHN